MQFRMVKYILLPSGLHKLYKNILPTLKKLSEKLFSILIEDFHFLARE